MMMDTILETVKTDRKSAHLSCAAADVPQVISRSFHCQGRQQNTSFSLST